MGTRSGDVDPALHEFIATQKGWSLDRIMQALNKESGLLGLSGRSNDMRTLVDAAAEGDERAQMAIEVFKLPPGEVHHGASPRHSAAWMRSSSPGESV